MSVLIGVIIQEEDEQLFTLENGSGRMIRMESTMAEKSYPNYPLLKQRPFRINDVPVSGAGVFRFRYGPVTSGIREAGCFHLYTYGEKILRATIDIGWKHREMEKAMQQRSPADVLRLAERVCSNFAFSHSVAFSRAAEMALGIKPTLATKNWRIILLEAERIYNHLYLIYKLASAAAQKVLAAHLSALFEEALRLNAQLSGSRYLMGINNIGKLDRLPELPSIQQAVYGYHQLLERFRRLYEHSLANPNYLDRLHAAGILTPAQAQALGLTGPSLHACGINDGLNDATGSLISLPVITQNEGDALARMEIRAGEIVNSCQYLLEHLKASDTWEDDQEMKHIDTDGTGYGVANSSSGAVGYYVTMQEGLIHRTSFFTPSYPGMHAVSQALEGLVFTDFPFVFDSFGVHFADAAR